MAELTVLLVIALLIAVNGLFVAAEFAIIGTSRAAMKARAERGDRRARRVSTVLADPVRQDRFIATAQLGITLASLGLGMYGEHAVAGWIVGGFERVGWAQWAGAHALASVLAIAVLSYLHVVIGEMVPKSLALSRADDAAAAVTGTMLWIQRLLQPLVLGLNGVGNALLRMVGIDRREAKAQHYTPEELELVVAESQRGGALPEIPGTLVRELLDFFELTAEQVMVPRVHVVGVPLGATRSQVAAILGRKLHTRYPVFEGDLDHLLGFVHAKDLARELPTTGVVTRQIVRETPYVPGSMRLDEVLEAMHGSGAQLAVVLDEHGGTAGILTVEDLLEELVGELEEDADARPEIVRLGEDALLAEGTARLEEIGEALDIELDHPEVDTVSGLVLDRLGHPAAAGDRVTWGEIELTVVSPDGRGVGRCSVRRRLVGADAGDGREEP
ncbi:MAG TPA: hemolysin family protein [Thermoanaerobaculia bacterium]|nr:hemolysin family protein [Thermoanaerobaculia bacterium]